MLVAATAYLFLVPDSDPLPRRADAVVVLAGGRSHRLDEGVRLWRAGVGRVLAISDGRQRDWPAANRLCLRQRVTCFDAEPFSTQGEARWIAREAARRGWDEVIVVTSTYHVRRARMIVRRCYDGGLAVVAAEPPLANTPIGVAWEWPKLAYYLAWNRAC